MRIELNFSDHDLRTIIQEEVKQQLAEEIKGELMEYLDLLKRSPDRHIPYKEAIVALVTEPDRHSHKFSNALDEALKKMVENIDDQGLKNALMNRLIDRVV